MRSMRILLATLCVCGFSAAGAADPVTLNARPGLWRMSSSGDAHGAAAKPKIPADLLARLTPAQRARLEAMLASNEPRPADENVHKVCVTRERLARGFDAPPSRPGLDCKPTIISQSAKAMDMREDCSGPHGHFSGSFHYEAPDPQTLKATLDMTMGEGPNARRLKRFMHGRWLSASCGKYAKE